MKYKLLAMSFIFVSVNELNAMLPSSFASTFQVVGQTVPQPQIRWRKLRRITYKKKICTRKQDLSLNQIKAPTPENQKLEIDEYFHKTPIQLQNNQDFNNINLPTAMPNFVQSYPMGRNPVPTELARQSKANESVQFIQQKRELLQPQNTPIQNVISEPVQPKNTPVETNLSVENDLEELFKEIEKCLSSEGIAIEKTENQEVSSSIIDTSATQQTEETMSMEDNSSPVLFRKKNKTEMTLDPIFSKYENNRDLGEFIDNIQRELPSNLLREDIIYIKKVLQILESDDDTGEYSARFLNKRYLDRCNQNNVNIFARIVKNMEYYDLVKAYNLYPSIILEPVNGLDIVTAFKPIKFLGKQGKLSFLKKYYKKAIENLARGELPEKAIE